GGSGLVGGKRSGAPDVDDLKRNTRTSILDGHHEPMNGGRPKVDRRAWMTAMVVPPLLERRRYFSRRDLFPCHGIPCGRPDVVGGQRQHRIPALEDGAGFTRGQAPTVNYPTDESKSQDVPEES